MREGPPLLRSQLQGRLLARLFLGGGEESVAELAAAAEGDPGNAAREIARLESAGVVVSRRGWPHEAGPVQQVRCLLPASAGAAHDRPRAGHGAGGAAC